MKLFNLILLIGLLVGCTSTPVKSPYLPRFGWEETPDFSELRRVWGNSDSFFSLCEAGRPLKEMIEKMNSQQWEESASIGLNWLSQCPIDIRAHYYTGISLAESGRETESKNHFRWTEGLMDSLVASGNGKSPKTAYETISIAEEYEALYFFGLEKKSQALISGPIMCDLLTATNEEGKEVSIYFNPAAHFIRLTKMLKK